MPNGLADAEHRADLAARARRRWWSVANLWEQAARSIDGAYQAAAFVAGTTDGCLDPGSPDGLRGREASAASILASKSAWEAYRHARRRAIREAERATVAEDEAQEATTAEVATWWKLGAEGVQPTVNAE
jgi:hypothetical protein